MKALSDHNPLPKMLPGTVQLQLVRCGKAACRCARGQLHEAFYRFWREDGRLRKAYVRRNDLEATRAACARWHEADGIWSGMLNSPAAQEQKRMQRATLRSALGEQAYTDVGQRLLRRLTR
jgi:hypothetical protein